MSKKLRIEGEGHDLSTARASVQSQLARGYVVKKEHVVADGNPHTTERFADTRDDALRLACQDVPDGAEVIDSECLREAETKVETLEAFDEAELPPQVGNRFGEEARIQSARPLQQVRKGVLGLGKRRGTFEVTVLVPAKARCTWKRPAKVVAELGIDPKICPSEPNGEHRWGRGSKCEACGKRGCLLCGKDITFYASGTPTPDHGIRCSGCSAFICNACLADKWGITESWQISSKRCPACRQHGLGAILYRV